MENDVIIKRLPKKNGTFENQITASRFYLQYSKLYFSSKDAVPMNLLRKLCLESGLPILPFSLTFKFYEQFDETLPNILQSFVISIEAMYVISLIFIPDLLSTFCIITSMVRFNHNNFVQILKLIFFLLKVFNNGRDDRFNERLESNTIIYNND